MCRRSGTFVRIEKLVGQRLVRRRWDSIALAIPNRVRQWFHY